MIRLLVAVALISALPMLHADEHQPPSSARLIQPDASRAINLPTDYCSRRASDIGPTAQDEQHLWRLISMLRHQIGLPQFHYSIYLSFKARAWACEFGSDPAPLMASLGGNAYEFPYMQHTPPNWYAIPRHEAAWMWGQSPDNVFEAWQQSPPHYAVLSDLRACAGLGLGNYWTDTEGNTPPFIGPLQAVLVVVSCGDLARREDDP